jgi:hypothetical protein
MKWGSVRGVHIFLKDANQSSWDLALCIQVVNDVIYFWKSRKWDQNTIDMLIPDDTSDWCDMLQISDGNPNPWNQISKGPRGTKMKESLASYVKTWASRQRAQLAEGAQKAITHNQTPSNLFR